MQELQPVRQVQGRYAGPDDGLSRILGIRT